MRQDHTGKNQGLLLTVDPARIHLGETLGKVEAQGVELMGENRIAVVMNRLEECEAKGLDSMTLSDLEDRENRMRTLMKEKT